MHINDCIVAALQTQTGLNLQLNDMLLVYYQNNGATSDNLDDAEREFLLAQGATPANENDMWLEVLLSLGAPAQSLQDNLYWFWCVNGGGVTPPGSDAAFQANTVDPATGFMVGVLKGVGDLTVAAGGGDKYAKDFGGVYRNYGEGAPVWSGGRQIINNCLESENISGVEWHSSGSQVGNVVTLPVSATAARYLVSGASAIGEVVVGRMYVPPASSWSDPDANMKFNFIGLNAATVNFTPNTVNGGAGGWVVTPAYVNTGDYWDWRLRNGSSGEVTVTEPLKFQFENLEGFSDTDTPNEYLKTTGVIRTETSAFYNGNTVDGDGVLIEGVGAALPEIPYLQYYPAATNVLFPSTTVGVETVNLPVGTWSINCIVNGVDIASSIVTAGTATATGYGIATPGNLIELDVTVEGTVSIENTGDILCCNVTSGATATARGLGPIFTTTAAVATTVTVYNNDIANHDDNAAYYAEVVLTDVDHTTNHIKVDIPTSGDIFGTGVGGLLVTTDTTGSINVAGSVIDTPQKVGVVHTTGGQKAINLNGVWGIDTGAGSWTTSLNALRYGGGSNYAFKIRNVQRYDGTDFDELKAIIDGLMT